jgi:hypothetical protein
MSARKQQYRLFAPVVPEHSIQRTIAGVLRLEIGAEAKPSPDGVTWFSIDHANNYDEVPGIRVGRGIPPGIFDMIVLYQGRAFWIELKSRDGTVSVPQRSMAATLLLSGCRIGVACDSDDVLRCLDEWGIPRKRRVRVAA